MAESRLPIGLQFFRSLREGNKVYVDKTHTIKALLDRGRYLLAGPRRFEKNLLISTLASLSRAKRVTQPNTSRSRYFGT